MNLKKGFVRYYAAKPSIAKASYGITVVGLLYSIPFFYRYIDD